MQKIVLEEKSLLIVTETTYSLPHDLPLEYPDFSSYLQYERSKLFGDLAAHSLMVLQVLLP